MMEIEESKKIPSPENRKMSEENSSEESENVEESIGKTLIYGFPRDSLTASEAKNLKEILESEGFILHSNDSGNVMISRKDESEESSFEEVL